MASFFNIMLNVERQRKEYETVADRADQMGILYS